MEPSQPPPYSRAAIRRPRFLLVDDDPAVIRGLYRLLKTLRPSAQINSAEGVERAVRLLGELHYDVVITDLQMPGESGMRVLEVLAARHPETMRIVHSSQLESADMARIYELADVVVPKPTSEEGLVDALERAALSLRLRAPYLQSR
jgi:DNA-binding NarL/FixJ family response regulator